MGWVRGAQILWVYRSRSRGVSRQHEECFYNHCTNPHRHPIQTSSDSRRAETMRKKQTKPELRIQRTKFGGERNPTPDCDSNR
jgi:hypothetical protein